MLDWLWNNPLGTMYGPYFLALYTIAIGTVIVGSRWLIRQGDETRHEPTPPVPETPDPYLVAWLRGNTNEVARLALFDLLQQGRIEQYAKKSAFGLVSTQMLRRAEGARGDDLSPLLNAVWKWLGTEREANKVFQSGLPEAVAPFTESLQADCERLGLITREEGLHGQRLIRGAGLLAIAALGGYKFTVALATGHHNVGGLIVLCLGGCVAELVLARTRRLTDLGRRTLKAMQTAFAGIQKDVPADATADPRLLLAMGVFGIIALQGTAHGGFYDLYRKSAAASGGCGAGIGASCGSASCGSGGGCGGGGCGGCGGS